jgi:hypothetical protein
MGLDIRLPIGGMFLFVGFLLTIYGAVRPQSSQSVGININLTWGVVLLIFGTIMVVLGRRGSRIATKAASEPAETRQPH